MRKSSLAVILSFLQLIVFCDLVPAQTNDGDKPVSVPIATASGEISYSKKEGPSKPSFTSIDVSQYYFAVFDASITVSGTCNAHIVIAAAPTDDKKQMTGYQWVKPGDGAVLVKLDPLIAEEGIIRRYNSSSFQISADLPVAGIALWYAESCKSTYTITVYAKGMKKCGTLPPLSAQLKAMLAELKTTTSYKRRSEIYAEISAELKRRGLGSGFFDAASATTNALNLDGKIGGFGGSAQKFLDDLSKELSSMNVEFARELLETGKLKKADGSGFISDLNKIDSELVIREQSYAGKKLAAQSDRTEIVSVINSGMNGWLASSVGSFTASGAAVNKVRERKRKTNPAAEFDYGNQSDRASVGEILASQYRRNFLPNAIYCK